MDDYKLIDQDGEGITFFTAQEANRGQFEKGKKKPFEWKKLFDRIRNLFNSDNGFDTEIETELEVNVKMLFRSLKIENPPDDIIQTFCLSGLFVDMFSSLKTNKYKDFMLRIICHIIKKFPFTIPIFMKRNLSSPFNTFLFAQGRSPEMEICAPYYVSKYLKCMESSLENPYQFFFATNESNYFQLSFLILDDCFSREMNAFSEKYIKKAISNIYQIFADLIAWIPKYSRKNESDRYNEIDQIFAYFAKAFEFKVEAIYLKLLKCFIQILNYSFDFINCYFISASINLPICEIINTQKPAIVQQDAMFLMYSLIQKPDFFFLSSEINSQSVFNTANMFHSMMIQSGKYEKTTINSILLLGQKFLIENNISIGVEDDMTKLIGLVSTILDDMQYEAKNAAAFMVFVLVQISKLSYFQQFNVDVVKKSFDVAISGDFLVVENAINAVNVLYGLIRDGDQFVLTLYDSLQEFVSTLYETNEIEELAQKIQLLHDSFPFQS